MNNRNKRMVKVMNNCYIDYIGNRQVNRV